MQKKNTLKKDEQRVALLRDVVTDKVHHKPQVADNIQMLFIETANFAGVNILHPELIEKVLELTMTTARRSKDARLRNTYKELCLILDAQLREH